MNPHYVSVLFLAAQTVVAAPATTLPAAVERAFDLYSALPSELLPTLREAQDKTSAEKVAGKLHKKLLHIYNTREAVHKMPALTAEQARIVEARYAHRMRSEWAKMYEEIERLRLARCYESAELWKEFRTMCMMIEK